MIRQLATMGYAGMLAACANHMPTQEGCLSGERGKPLLVIAEHGGRMVPYADGSVETPSLVLFENGVAISDHFVDADSRCLRVANVRTLVAAVAKLEVARSSGRHGDAPIDAVEVGVFVAKGDAFVCNRFIGVSLSDAFRGKASDGLGEVLALMSDIKWQTSVPWRGDAIGISITPVTASRNQAKEWPREWPRPDSPAISSLPASQQPVAEELSKSSVRYEGGVYDVRYLRHYRQDVDFWAGHVKCVDPD